MMTTACGPGKCSAAQLTHLRTEPPPDAVVGEPQLPQKRLRLCHSIRARAWARIPASPAGRLVASLRASLNDACSMPIVVTGSTIEDRSTAKWAAPSRRPSRSGAAPSSRCARTLASSQCSPGSSASLESTFNCQKGRKRLPAAPICSSSQASLRRRLDARSNGLPENGMTCFIARPLR